eukprot:gene11252-11401_t
MSSASTAQLLANVGLGSPSWVWNAAAEQQDFRSGSLIELFAPSPAGAAHSSAEDPSPMKQELATDSSADPMLFHWEQPGTIRVALLQGNLQHAVCSLSGPADPLQLPISQLALHTPSEPSPSSSTSRVTLGWDPSSGATRLVRVRPAGGSGSSSSSDSSALLEAFTLQQDQLVPAGSVGCAGGGHHHQLAWMLDGLLVMTAVSEVLRLVDSKLAAQQLTLKSSFSVRWDSVKLAVLDGIPDSIARTVSIDLRLRFLSHLLKPVFDVVREVSCLGAAADAVLLREPHWWLLGASSWNGMMQEALRTRGDVPRGSLAGLAPIMAYVADTTGGKEDPLYSAIKHAIKAAPPAKESNWEPSLRELYKKELQLHSNFRKEWHQDHCMQEAPAAAVSDPQLSVASLKRRRWQQQLDIAEGDVHSVASCSSSRHIFDLAHMTDLDLLMPGILQSVDGMVFTLDNMPVVDGNKPLPKGLVLELFQHGWVYACPMSGEMWLRNSC